MRFVVRMGTMLVLAAALGAAPAMAQDAEPGQEKQEKREPPKVDFDKLKFMSGCWRGQLDRETEIEEIWSEPAANLIVGTTRYLGKKNRATGFEFSRIELTDTAVVFSASSGGRPFDSYALKNLYHEYVVFENLTKGFPQRIIYRLASDGALIPRNEGDGQPSVELRMQRVKCPGT